VIWCCKGIEKSEARDKMQKTSHIANDVTGFQKL
jgi:hypothetical protein